MKQTITFRGTRAELRAMLGKLLAEIPAKGGEYADLVRGIKLKAGMTALKCIQDDFEKKSNGGTGDDGITWDELKKETVAYSRNGDEPKTKAQRGLLSDTQNARWRRLFFIHKSWFMTKFGMGEKEAAAQASKVAWATLKKEGARTKLEYYGSRKVPIGRNSNRLFESLSPGTPSPEEHSILNEPPDEPNPGDRILRDEAGSVFVGSNVDYAARFHAKRKLWPDNLPDAWQEKVEAATASGIAEAIVHVVGGRA